MVRGDALTRCLGPKIHTWTGVFDNAGTGNPQVRLAHSGGQALHSITDVNSKAYNAKFQASKKSSVELAHNNGRVVSLAGGACGGLLGLVFACSLPAAAPAKVS